MDYKEIIESQIEALKKLQNKNIENATSRADVTNCIPGACEIAKTISQLVEKLSELKLT